MVSLPKSYLSVCLQVNKSIIIVIVQRKFNLNLFWYATVSTLPYISLGVTDNVPTHTVPTLDDGLSEPINVQFAFGNQLESTLYVSINVPVN